MITRDEYVGGILALSQERRGIQRSLQYVSSDRVLIEYDFPLAEIILDFYDKLKSVSRGYASFDYELADYREGDLVKLDMLINGEPVDALVDHRAPAEGAPQGEALVDKMKELIPRQIFEVRSSGGDRREDRRALDREGACARTSSPSATAATSPASASSSRSRKRARSG